MDSNILKLPPPPRWEFTCLECQKGMLTMSTLKEHIAIDHLNLAAWRCGCFKELFTSEARIMHSVTCGQLIMEIPKLTGLNQLDKLQKMTSAAVEHEIKRQAALILEFGKAFMERAKLKPADVDNLLRASPLPIVGLEQMCTPTEADPSKTVSLTRLPQPVFHPSETLANFPLAHAFSKANSLTTRCVPLESNSDKVTSSRSPQPVPHPSETLANLKLTSASLKTNNSESIHKSRASRLSPRRGDRDGRKGRSRKRDHRSSPRRYGDRKYRRQSHSRERRRSPYSPGRHRSLSPRDRNRRSISPNDQKQQPISIRLLQQKAKIEQNLELSGKAAELSKEMEKAIALALKAPSIDNNEMMDMDIESPTESPKKIAVSKIKLPEPTVVEPPRIALTREPLPENDTFFKELKEKLIYEQYIQPPYNPLAPRREPLLPGQTAYGSVGAYWPLNAEQPQQRQPRVPFAAVQRPCPFHTEKICPNVFLCAYQLNLDERIKKFRGGGGCPDLRCIKRHSGNCRSLSYCLVCKEPHHQIFCPYLERPKKMEIEEKGKNEENAKA